MRPASTILIIQLSNSRVNMKGATASAAGSAGYVPGPAAGDQDKFLKADGTWQTPAGTTYNEATQSASGLMSAADKKKLDEITEITTQEIDEILAS